MPSADRMVTAASAWIAGLSPAQRAAAVLPWPSSEERHRWFYTPTDHGGLSLGEMRPEQQRQAMQLVATGLSDPGYVTASTIMGLENVLDKSDNWSVSWDRPRGRDPQLYYLTVFGTPSPSGAWSWRFGGHHLSVHHVVLDGEVVSSSPAFLGADPATAPLLGGHLLRPLGALEDLARDLLSTLDDSQLAGAVICPVAPVDIVGGNRAHIRDGDRMLPLPEVWRGHFTDPRLRDLAFDIHQRAETRAGTQPAHHEAVALTDVPKGLPARLLSSPQKEQLRALLDVYLGRIPEELAAVESAKFAGDRLDAVHFAWAGDTRPGHPHYYRLQGPALLAEYDNTQRNANHVHTVWRNPANDFGDDVLARHLATFHR